MSRTCQLTKKKANNGFAISHSHRRTKKRQEVNLQSKRVWWPEGNRWVKLKLSTKAIKTLETKGLQAMAKEAGDDEFAARMQENLDRYRQEQPCRLPWPENDPLFALVTYGK